MLDHPVHREGVEAPRALFDFDRRKAKAHQSLDDLADHVHAYGQVYGEARRAASALQHQGDRGDGVERRHEATCYSAARSPTRGHLNEERGARLRTLPRGQHVCDPDLVTSAARSKSRRNRHGLRHRAERREDDVGRDAGLVSDARRAERVVENGLRDVARRHRYGLAVRFGAIAANNRTSGSLATGVKSTWSP